MPDRKQRFSVVGSALGNVFPWEICPPSGKAEAELLRRASVARHVILPLDFYLFYSRVALFCGILVSLRESRNRSNPLI